MSIDDCNAYVLHARPYRETSLLLEVFTESQGRTSIVARGAKSPKSKFRGLLQPFVPLLLKWGGNSSLKTLYSAESVVAPFVLKGNKLACGFYLNELLSRLLTDADPYPELFYYYQQALQQLMALGKPDAALRPFELFLLNQLGYGFSLKRDAMSGEAISPSVWYRFDPDSGIVRMAQQVRPEAHAVAFKGEDLLAMQAGAWQELSVCQAAKRLMRLALAPHLGGKPLASRSLFQGHGVVEPTQIS